MLNHQLLRKPRGHLMKQATGLSFTDSTFRILRFPHLADDGDTGQGSNVAKLISHVLGDVSDHAVAPELQDAILRLFRLLEFMDETFHDMQSHQMFFDWVANHWDVASGIANGVTVRSIIHCFKDARVKYTLQSKTKVRQSSEVADMVSLHINSSKRYMGQSDPVKFSIRPSSRVQQASFLLDARDLANVVSPLPRPADTMPDWPPEFYLPEEVLIFAEPTLRSALWGVSPTLPRLGNVELAAPLRNDPPVKVRMYLSLIALRTTRASSRVRLFPTPIQRFDDLKERCKWTNNTRGETGSYASIEEFAKYAKTLLLYRERYVETVFGLVTPSCGAIDDDIPLLVAEEEQLQKDAGKPPLRPWEVYNKRCPRMGIAVGVRLFGDLPASPRAEPRFEIVTWNTMIEPKEGWGLSEERTERLKMAGGWAAWRLAGALGRKNVARGWVSGVACATDGPDDGVREAAQWLAKKVQDQDTMNWGDVDWVEMGFGPDPNTQA